MQPGERFHQGTARARGGAGAERGAQDGRAHLHAPLAVEARKHDRLDEAELDPPRAHLPLVDQRLRNHDDDDHHQGVVSGGRGAAGNQRRARRSER